MPVRRFAGQAIRFIPFLGDILNATREYSNQVEAGIPPVRAIRRTIPVAVTGMVTNIVDPFGVSNVAPEVLRKLAAKREQDAREGKDKRIFFPQVSAVKKGLDPLVTSGVLPYVAMGAIYEDPAALRQAAKLADQVNSEAQMRSIVDRIDPLTTGQTFSMDPNERFDQLVEYLNRRAVTDKVSPVSPDPQDRLRQLVDYLKGKN